MPEATGERVNVEVPALAVLTWESPSVDPSREAIENIYFGFNCLARPLVHTFRHLALFFTSLAGIRISSSLCFVGLMP